LSIFIKLRRPCIPRLWIMLTIAASLKAALLLLVLTDGQLGASFDSVAYLGAAESIRAGDGPLLPYFMHDGHPVPLQPGEPLAHWPPGYPYLIAGLHPLAVVVACALLSPILAGASIRIAAGQWTWHAPAAAWLVSLAPGFAAVHSMIWSEPPFIALVLFVTLCMAAFRQNGRLGWLALASAGAAGTFLLRYLGLAVIIAVVFGALRSPSRTAGHRLQAVALPLTAGLFAFAMVALLYGRALWENANEAQHQSGGSGILSAVHGGVRATFENFAAGSLPLGLALGVLVALSLASSPLMESGRDAFLWPWLAAAVYLVVLILAHTRVPTIPFDGRLLSPMMVLVAVGIPEMFTRRSGALGPVTVMTVAATWLLALPLHGPQTWGEAWDVVGCSETRHERTCDILGELPES
jgi:hypothetical protein